MNLSYRVYAPAPQITTELAIKRLEISKALKKPWCQILFISYVLILRNVSILHQWARKAGFAIMSMKVLLWPEKVEEEVQVGFKILLGYPLKRRQNRFWTKLLRFSSFPFLSPPPSRGSAS